MSESVFLDSWNKITTGKLSERGRELCLRELLAYSYHNLRPQSKMNFLVDTEADVSMLSRAVINKNFHGQVVHPYIPRTLFCRRIFCMDLLHLGVRATRELIACRFV